MTVMQAPGEELAWRPDLASPLQTLHRRSLVSGQLTVSSAAP